jgi:hypothetical protein
VRSTRKPSNSNEHQITLQPLPPGSNDARSPDRIVRAEVPGYGDEVSGLVRDDFALRALYVL